MILQTLQKQLMVYENMAMRLASVVNEFSNLELLKLKRKTLSNRIYNP